MKQLIRFLFYFFGQKSIVSIFFANNRFFKNSKSRPTKLFELFHYHAWKDYHLHNVLDFQIRPWLERGPSGLPFAYILYTDI